MPYEQMMELGAGLRAPPTSAGAHLMTAGLQRNGGVASGTPATGPGAAGGFSPVGRPSPGYSPGMPPPPPPHRAPPGTAAAWTPTRSEATASAAVPAHLHGHGRHVEAAHAQHGAHADSALGTARSGAVWASVLNGTSAMGHQAAPAGPRSAVTDLLGAGLDIQDIARATARRADM